MKYLDSGQIELLQTFCEDYSYDYPMIPDIPKQDGPSIANCGSDVLTANQVSQNKVIIAISVFSSSKSYFVRHTQQLVVVDKTFFGTEFLY